MASSANDFRLRGNHEFSLGNYDNAKALYTAALDASPTNDDAVILHCNRSACCYQMDDFEGSLADAETAWKLSVGTSTKAAYRLAKSALAMKQYDVVKTTVEAALRILQDQELIITVMPAPTMPDRRVDRKKRQAETPIKPSVSNDDIAQQRASFQELMTSAWQAQCKPVEGPEVSILHVTRPVSIREFEIIKELGSGNFSEIFQVKHKVTGEIFALKKINKKQAADLYKRQHPNVYNEIQMERRCLLERIRNIRYVVPMYHAFQDFENLYYLMQLQYTDLWSQLRYKNLPGYGDTVGAPQESLVMMGCHRSPAKRWIRQVIDALEAIHRLGIVHRTYSGVFDLCCEVFQDLTRRLPTGDLKSENILLDEHHNVVLIDFGTAKDLILTDLNGPEFVGTPDFMSVEAVSEDGPPAGPTADLWALGCLAFVMQTGHTPYWSPSPYLAFLKIKRARKYFNVQRPGGIIDDDCWDFICALLQGDPKQRLGYAEAHKDINYDSLRNHPYLVGAEQISFLPSLWDLAVRACAEMAYKDSLNIELCDRHPPGDGSKHDLLRLGPRERSAVLHCLDRRRLLSDYRLYSRFFSSPPDRVRQYDVVGLTQMNDDQGKPNQTHDPYSKHKAFIPIRIAQVFSPILQQQSQSSLDDDAKKQMTKLFKKCVSAVNRSRPDVVIVAGNITPNIRKILAKVSDTIPVVVHDGTKDFTLWKSGVQCIAVSSSSCNENWLQQELEIATMSKHPVFVYTALDPRTLPISLIDSLAAGRTHGLFGVSEQCYDFTVDGKRDPEDDRADEDWKMKVHSWSNNGVNVVTVFEEPDQWISEFEAVDSN